jgi:hypothetical protein
VAPYSKAKHPHEPKLSVVLPHDLAHEVREVLARFKGISITPLTAHWLCVRAIEAGLTNVIADLMDQARAIANTAPAKESDR